MVFFFCTLVGETAPAIIGALDPGDKHVGKLMVGGMVFSYSTSAVLFFVLARWIAMEGMERRSSSSSENSSSRVFLVDDCVGDSSSPSSLSTSPTTVYQPPPSLPPEN